MHVSLRAEGYVATRARLEARGMPVREFTVGDRHLVQFLDPDGLEVELTFSPSELPNGPVRWVARWKRVEIDQNPFHVIAGQERKRGRKQPLNIIGSRVHGWPGFLARP